MPSCIVFGLRGVDVVAITARVCPKATITKFNDDGGLIGVFSEDPTKELRTAGLYVTKLEENLNNVFWCQFLIRGSPGTPSGTETIIAKIMKQYFNGRTTGEKARFLIPVPFFTDATGHYREINFKMAALQKIQWTMEKHCISAEIGFAR